jgi:hypothetical protein
MVANRSLHAAVCKPCSRQGPQTKNHTDHETDSKTQRHDI